MADKRTDSGQYYPGGRVIARPGAAPQQVVVQWSDVQGKPQVAPLPERYRDGDMKTKINEIASKFAMMVVAAFVVWTACADVTVQKKRKDEIYNDELVVVDVTGGGGGVDTNAVERIANAAVATNAVTVGLRASVSSLESSKLSKSDVIDPASATTNGKAADAKATGDALAGKIDRITPLMAGAIPMLNGDGSLAEGPALILPGTRNVSFAGGVDAMGDINSASGSIQGNNVVTIGDVTIVNPSSGATLHALSKKANRPSSVTSGNLASLTENGDLEDSGKKASDFLPSSATANDIPQSGWYGAENVNYALGEAYSAINGMSRIIDEKADRSMISATDPTFSAAVLGVGLDIDADTLQWLKDIGAIAGTTTGKVGIGTLLAALLAALMWLKNNKYEKPSAGIPKSDLASAVQTSLGKADTALQSVPLASSSKVGGVKPVAVSADMTQPVGVDNLGKLFTKAGGGGLTGHKLSVFFSDAEGGRTSANLVMLFADGHVEQGNTFVRSMNPWGIYLEHGSQRREFNNVVAYCTGSIPNSIVGYGGSTSPAANLIAITEDTSTYVGMGCFLGGTKIALADGSEKNIEDVTYDDDLLVWDFDRGCKASAKPAWIQRDFTTREAYVVEFASGRKIHVTGFGKTGRGHRFYDLDRKAFKFMPCAVGDNTVDIDGKPDRIVSCTVEAVDDVPLYNIITKRHFNMYADGILTSCVLNNMYDIDTALHMYSKDGRAEVSFGRFESELAKVSDVPGFAGMPSDVARRMYDDLRVSEQRIKPDRMAHYAARLYVNMRMGG